jgi:hypothetical protein
MRFPLLLTAALSLQACGYVEPLIIENLHGTVHIPAAATERDGIDEDGNLFPMGPDVRALGPVYLGLFPSVLPAGTLERYPYPEVGPQFKEGIPGDTYPYGGTTVGELRFACLQSLACYTVSGRYTSYDSMLEWFQLIGVPVTDANDDVVTSGEFIRQTCFDLFNVNSDREVRLIGEDKNEDGKVTDDELDFVFDEQANEWVGDFEIRQQELFYDTEQKNCTPGRDCRSMTLWGWTDAPANGSFTYKTCDTTEGFNLSQYNETFTGGRVWNDLLNFPTKYIEAGDYVASQPYEWKDIYSEPDIYFDFPVQ